MINPLKDYAESHGVEIMLNTKAEELIQDETGKVVGVQVSQGDQTATISANNSVVLATGGFGANVEMREHYNTRWETLDASVKTTNSPAIVGDGIVMAEKIGAHLINMEHIQLYPFNNPITGVFYGIEAPSWSSEGLIYVNKDGKRFVNEVAMRDVRAEGILAQGGLVYAIYNQEVADRLNLEEKFADEYARCLEDGVFFKADTLEDLLTQCGFEGDALDNALASVERYNELAKAGSDDDFGKPASRMFALENPPYYACQWGTTSMLVCVGGLESDENCHTFTEEDPASPKRDIIKGLYVCGNVQGSRYAVEYPICMRGISHSLCVYYGYIAGKNCVAGV